MTNRFDRGTGAKKTLLYVITIIISILFLFIGNRIVTRNLGIFDQDYGEEIAKARVVSVVDRDVEEYNVDGNTLLENIQITFEAEILNGAYRGETVTASQTIDNIHYSNMSEAEQGDRLLLVYSEQDVQGWHFLEFIRTDMLLVLGILLVVSLLIFGRRKGFNTILSLVFTCAAIFTVFIPSILSGHNIYICAILVCLYAIMMTFLIVNGLNKKTWAAAAGSFGGIAVSGLLIFIMDRVLSLTGIVDDDSLFLTYLPTEMPIDLNAIIFAAIIIGAMGAIMDVSMSISSSLWEVKEEARDATRDSLFKSGINIGRDIMGTMSNTLILAYIGSSLSVVLLLSVYSTSLLYLLNREMIVVEILKALVGSFGILVTMPLTSLICAVSYTRVKPRVIRLKR